ncbi:NlpC/P60 family protein [Amycolatopsis suaedae]|uniref:NlpC/P60 family protein n=1 Tax=Amycolatopsis suaedae TaxID=2510978 RepID=A0A4Q7JCN9_9PSEU|nr:NlpC/P60 family protein [Amycolatopsis suaedae]
MALAAVGALVAVLTQLAPPDPAPTVSAAPAPAAEQPPAPSTQPEAAVPDDEAQLNEWVTKVSGWLDIPPRAMLGYARATVTLTAEEPKCNVSWVTLAGIGKNASDHGRAGGGLGDAGTAAKPIGTVEVRDFYGKPVSKAGSSGPMQLPPEVWNGWKRSHTGTAEPDIQNIDDAALTAGRALCADGRDLSDGPTWWEAVRSVQDAPLFLHRVLATANVYGTVIKDNAPPNPAVLKAVTFAIDKIGLPYVWGGNGTEKGDAGFDCSGLTTAAYASAGITLKRTAHWQYGSVPLVPKETEPKLGDLIFYGNPSTKIHHVGLYVGNRQMVDAPTFGQAVQVHPYRKPNDSYAGAGRPAA